jgi:hypothetical protein
VKQAAHCHTICSQCFSWLDESGAVYEANVQHGIMINMQKPGRHLYGQGMNPRLKLTQDIVFEVPRGEYSLQVIVPNRASLGFAGSVMSSGPFSLYDISTQLRN